MARETESTEPLGLPANTEKPIGRPASVLEENQHASAYHGEGEPQWRSPFYGQAITATRPSIDARICPFSVQVHGLGYFGAHKRRVQDNECFRRRRAGKSGAPACRRDAQSDIQRVPGRNPLPSILLGLIHMLPETFYFSWTIDPANHHLAYDQRKARSTIPNLGLLTVSADRKLTCFG